MNFSFSPHPQSLLQSFFFFYPSYMSYSSPRYHFAIVILITDPLHLVELSVKHIHFQALGNFLINFKYLNSLIQSNFYIFFEVFKIFLDYKKLK